MNIGRNPELTFFRVFKRHVIQITPDPELDPAGLSHRKSIPHVISHRLAEYGWQVAVNARPIGTAEYGLQIQHPRKARAPFGLRRITGFPFDLRLALGVGIAELQVGQLQRNVFALDLPFDLS